MEKVTNFWNSLNGSKTNIGAGLMLASKVCEVFPSTQPMAEPLFKLGEFMAGIGLGHKFLK